MEERERIVVQVFVPALDGSDMLIPMEYEVTDPDTIAKLKIGAISNFQLVKAEEKEKFDD